MTRRRENTRMAPRRFSHADPWLDGPLPPYRMGRTEGHEKTKSLQAHVVISALQFFNGDTQRIHRSPGNTIIYIFILIILKQYNFY